MPATISLSSIPTQSNPSMPESTTFPHLEMVDFKLPIGDELPSLSSGLTQNGVVMPDWPALPSIDTLEGKEIDKDYFNIDRLNKVNEKRLNDIEIINTKPQTPDIDALDKKLFNFLDREGGNNHNFSSAVTSHGE